MPRHGREGGGGGAAGWARWARRWWRALLAETLGTALLVSLGCASLRPSAPPASAPPPLTHPALAFGAAVTWLVQALGPVSGAHLNPALTLAAVLAGRHPPAAAAAYVVAQCAGGVLGAAALLPLSPSLEYCVTSAPPVGAVAAAGVEAVLTGALAWLACALWAAHDAARPDHSAPLKLGFTVAGLVCSGGPLSHASLNPARSLAPALFTAVWRDHWVYWVGPLGGAAGAALLHGALAPPRPAPADIPLRDKTEP